MGASAEAESRAACCTVRLRGVLCEPAAGAGREGQVPRIERGSGAEERAEEASVGRIECSVELRMILFTVALSVELIDAVRFTFPLRFRSSD